MSLQKNNNTSSINSSLKIIEGPQLFWECDCISQGNYIHTIDEKFCIRCKAEYRVSRLLTDAEEILNFLTLG